MQHPQSSRSPSAQRAAAPLEPTKRLSRRTRSPPAKRRRISASSSASPSLSPSPSPSPSPEPQPTITPISARKWFRKPSVVWYRGNDLRVDDHPALCAAAQRGGPVVPLFVWDPCDGFGADLGHVKKWWLSQSLYSLDRDLRRLGVQLYIRTGPCTEELRRFLRDTGADAVFWNRCYEPGTLFRDEKLRVELASEGLTAESFKAELLVEPWELTNTEVSPRFETFHAYMRAWMHVPPPPPPFPCPVRLQPIGSHVKSVTIDALGFDIPESVSVAMSKQWKPGSAHAKVRLEKFLREVLPAFGEGRCRRHFEGTSRLSPHIRFGELSPRRMYYSTRLRVSKGSMLLIDLPPPRNVSSIPTSGVVEKGKGKKSEAVLETPENGTTAKRKREGENVTMNSPPCRRARPEAVREGQPKREADGRPSPVKTEQKRWSVPQKGSSTLSRRITLPHITVSARAFLKNLCLRDFAYHVLFHSPDFVTQPLIPEFVNFPWAEDDGAFESWRMAKTGYPIVDAAMRELRETGWTHNRMRFLLACFLTKHLLLPWSRGLKEFYGLLIDGDRSSNALGWQWTAGSNTDAFPMSYLVNPVKVAVLHDPMGNYVRRWLPELAKLPTKFLHEPWKAPPELLRSFGIELGTTYPKRVVLMSQARKRAIHAMRVMKQILAGSGILRGVFSEKDNECVKEWPEEQPEVIQVDETSNFTGKLNLLPSLWALLQGDQNSTYFSPCSSGNDSLIAMDTANLAEGALVVPLDDQPESIEQALITAHAQDPPEALSIAAEAVAAGDRALGEPTYAQDKKCDTQGMITGNTTANGVAADHLGEPLKYDGADVGTFAEPEKVAVQPRSQFTDGASTQADTMANIPRPRHAMHSSPMQSNVKTMQVSTAHSYNPDVSPSPYSQQPQQQIQHFQQLQQLQQFQLQQLHMQQQRQQQQSRQQQHHPQQHHRPQHQPPLQQLHHSHSQTTQQQQQQSHVHPVMDGIYGHVSSNGSVPVTSVAGVPMAGAPVMMGPAAGNQEVSINTMLPGTEPGSAVYTHQLGMSQLYEFPQVMPVMNPHAVSVNERSDGVGAAAPVNTPKLTVPGMLPMAYGMYGGAMDHNILGNTFTSQGPSYGSAAASSQLQTHGGSQPQYGFSPHPMYFPSSGSDMPHPQGSAQLPQAFSSRVPTQIRQTGMATPTQARNVTAAAAAAAVAAGGREVANNVASDSQTRSVSKPQRISKELDNAEGLTPPMVAARSPGVDAVKSPSSNSNSVTSKPAPVRSSGKSGVRSRVSSRRKGPDSGAIGRNRGDSRASSGPRRRGTEEKSSATQQRGPSEDGQLQETTLKARQEMLDTVVAKEDHEYHAFASYLALTYELTGNTDRHTSKDYIRLCNLKDAYHKQCETDKDKLKIYRIKTFFSKVLNLQVTGEWDRHNHGGVRGPYVYGIRMRKTADSSRRVTLKG